MRTKMGSVIAASIALALSTQIDAKGEKSKAQQEFEEDPTNLAIAAGRWSVLIELSNSGLDLLEQPAAELSIDHASYLLRADAALKDGALQLLLLRNRLLHRGLVKSSDVRSKSWPAWIFEPPTSKVSPDTLVARLHWLETEASELVEIGCEIGRQRTDEPLFCSVE